MLVGNKKKTESHKNFYGLGLGSKGFTVPLFKRKRGENWEGGIILLERVS